jgi:pimeloyl-ACP methyl ester carboxylesterase
MAMPASAVIATGAGWAATAPAARPTIPTELRLAPCAVKGVAHEVPCGSIRRPLDPDESQGRTIEVHVAVLPAVARNKHPDPIFFLAGGPGQSAIDLAGTVQAMLGRFGNRRDIVLVDQRGTGRSAPLECEKPDPWLSLAQAANEDTAVERRRACLAELQAKPHGDLRFYTTTIAMHDLEAVRAALGPVRINLVGGSYGTRAALEYMRLYPRHVRSAVLDGVAPPDMGLTGSFSADNQAALDAALDACAADAACERRYPMLRAQWQRLLTSLPRPITEAHPMTGVPETFELTRSMVLGAVRRALYVPALAAALPAAIDAGARGRHAPLLALTGSLGNVRIAEGMHFSVVCAEDVPVAPGGSTGGSIKPVRSEPRGMDFRDDFDRFYAKVCEWWPRGKVSDDFRVVPEAAAPTLLLSGGADPATPARHGERVAKLLGDKATHLVVPHAGHGVMALACVREAIYHFVERADQSPAPRPVLPCAERIPRPRPFVPPSRGGASAGTAE